ncbi:MAG: HAD family hydrolase [Lachnospirales bacterium]
MLKYILFDLDGTLTDAYEGITNSVKYSLEYFGIHIEDKSVLKKFIGPPLKESYMVFYDFDDEKANKAVEKYREYFSPKGVFENRVYEGIKELLENLKNMGLKLVVCTSKPQIYAKRITEHFDLDKYFEYVCGSELDGRRTNKAEVIEYAINKFNIDKDNVIMVGDRLHDIVGANKNGIKSIGVLFGFGSEKELNETGADFIAKTPQDIKNIICNLKD